MLLLIPKSARVRGLQAEGWTLEFRNFLGMTYPDIPELQEIVSSHLNRLYEI